MISLLKRHPNPGNFFYHVRKNRMKKKRGGGEGVKKTRTFTEFDTQPRNPKEKESY